jgi:membrane fusion protein (multidrug efflux system)
VNAETKIENDPIGDAMTGEPAFAIDPAVADSRRRRWRMLLLVGVPVLLLGLAAIIYLRGGRFQETENANVQSARVAVSASVAGRVVAVLVQENQHVKAGDLLFRLDPAPFQADVAQKEAELAAMRLKVEALRLQVAQGRSELSAAGERVTFANRELARQKALLAEGISSQAQYDRALLEARTARQAVQTNERQNDQVLAGLAGRSDLPAALAPGVRQAQAALDRAKLDLAYTAVRASQDGIVTKVHQLQVGSYVDSAKPLFWLVGERLWIEANFKEDQLAHMRLGQRATVRINAFPDLDLNARVTSFSPGTGNSFSILPPENATGNWVKVVQRLPIELTLDAFPRDVPLHAGLSADVSVDTGYRRHLFGGIAAPAASPGK